MGVSPLQRFANSSHAGGHFRAAPATTPHAIRLRIG